MLTSCLYSSHVASLSPASIGRDQQGRAVASARPHARKEPYLIKYASTARYCTNSEWLHCFPLRDGLLAKLPYSLTPARVKRKGSDSRLTQIMSMIQQQQHGLATRCHRRTPAIRSARPLQWPGCHTRHLTPPPQLPTQRWPAVPIPTLQM